MGEEPKTQKEFFAEWLEKLQQESWQLELLISGLALFGIWETKDWLWGLRDYLDANTIGAAETILNLLMSVLAIGWVIFFTNLLIHIILRGFWIGAIGLRYVSGEIKYDEFSYSEIFTKYLKRKVGDFDDFIERLEKLSSIIFSYTFLLFFLFLSFLLLIVELVAFMGMVRYFLGADQPDMIYAMIFGILILIYAFFLVLIIIDVITLGGFRKIKDPTVAKIYLFFYKIFSVLTLSFFYRPILYNFLDNKYTKRLFLLGIPYGIIIALILPGFFINSSSLYPQIGELNATETILASRYSINPNYYDDLRKDLFETTGRREEIYYVSTAEYELSGKLIPLFFRFRAKDEDLLNEMGIQNAPFVELGIRHNTFSKNYLRNDPVEDSLKLENSKERLVMKKVIRDIRLNEDEIDSSYISNYEAFEIESIDSLSEQINDKWNEKKKAREEDRLSEIISGMQKLHEVRIDSNLIVPVKCLYHVHPNLKEKGIICYYIQDSLSLGPHEIQIDRKVPNRSKSKIYSIKKMYIPILKN